MKRWFAVCISLVFVAGCSGMGGGGSRFLPGASGIDNVSAPASNDATLSGNALGVVDAGARRDRLRVAVTMRIPKRHRGERIPMHPSTISSLTKSVSFAVNGSKAQVFNATPSSPNCSVGVNGTTCTFAVGAPAGNDTFVVTTYSGTGGGGSALDRGTAIVVIAKGKANSPHITLGPVVSNTADTGTGSLRYAIGTANRGDTVLFMIPSGATIKLLSPITLNASISLAGIGVKATALTRRHRNNVTSHTTFSGISISGGGTQQLFVIPAGVVTTISGLILADGYAGVAHSPGGLINNNGNLTLASDALTGSTSAVTTLRVRPHHLHAEHHAAPRGRKRARPGAVPHPVHHKKRSLGLHPHCVGNTTYAGAVYNDGTLVVSGSTFDSNTVSSGCGYYGYGGAIYNDDYGTLVSSNSTYSNNGGEYGGAIYNYSDYGQASFTGDQFIANFGCTDVNGCATTGCVLNSSCTTYAGGEGAAIYDDYGPGVTITSSKFTNNFDGGATPESWGEGGALYLAAGTPVITGSTFTGNLAGGGNSNCSYGDGGAIYEDASNAMVLNNDTFSNNKAGGDDYGYGGAIYSDAQPEIGSNDTFTGNVAYGTGSGCTSNAEAYGGALYMDYGGTLSNSTFSGNVSTSAYYSEGGVIYSDDPLTLTSDTFTGNKCIGTGATDEDSYCEGGVVYSGYDSLKISNSTFTGNAAEANGPYGYEIYGGVIYNYYPFQSAHNVFSGNTARTTYLDDGYIYGGVVYSDDTFQSLGDTFKSNTASTYYYTYGGVLYVSSTTTLSNDTFTSNAATGPYAYGGAIYNADYYTTTSGSTFTGNVAGTGSQSGYGGAIYDDYYETINGSTFTGNSASAAGGAVYDDDSDTFNYDVFTGNKVTAAQPYYGGGALYDEGPSTVNNSTFSGNSVTSAGLWSGGGAIYDDSGLTMSGSTLSGNVVNSSLGTTGGGGLALYDSATVTNSTISGNTSTSSGGGIIDFSTYSIYFNNATVYQNKATKNGGNIENPYSLTLTNTIVAGGTAGGTGQDIDNPGTVYTSDYNIIGKGVTGGSFTAAMHDRVGSNSVPVNPLLAVLNNNGGPTMTNADSATSPGRAYVPVSAGYCNNTSINTDQRGYARGATKCDVGAYEYGAGPSLVRTHFATSHHRHVRHHHGKPPKPAPALPLGVHPHHGKAHVQ